ncbi:alpha-L-rhamnosidase C-terminal domain-containing protein [Streptomyces leeuwenhoekii]|uniref:alpha-L-rhamnosidase C-terminal domain-containing protein n=1 Tax=Streptomyces leeuwenhoekii TaxID=1437453 RepID=UPI0037011002
MTAAAPGYRDIVFRPRPGGGISWARTRHDTPYGIVSLAWEATGTGLIVYAEVPDGCRATAELPGCPPVPLGPGRHALDSAKPGAGVA